MPFTIVVAHLLLAVLLFFLVNWLGRHSISSGYLQLSLFAKTDEAPAFNFLFRVLAPTVYMVLVASLFYSLGAGDFVDRFYLVAVYYVLVRWIFNIVTERGRLLNWRSQFAVGAAVVSVAYFADTQIISRKQNLLPDFANVANELWIIILIFLYQLANKITLSTEGTIRRKRLYLEHRFRSLRGRYEAIIRQEASGYPQLESLAYAVLIYETFNRPTVYRWIEAHILFPLGLGRSLGPMQVQTTSRLSDEEAVRLGVRKLLADFNQLGGNHPGEGYHDFRLIYETLQRYNVRSDYPGEVYQIYQEVSRIRQPEQASSPSEAVTA